jgi:AcrR family transcriptional regulator
MKRKYELKKRAESQAQTRRRIVEAAIELHRTKGPARTTLSDIAKGAGVQRNTLYRHFADERAVGLACSGLYMELNPPPDATSWSSIADPKARLRHGLGELYGWFAEVQDMLGSVLRDAEIDPLTREMFELRAGEAMGAMRTSLTAALPSRRRAQAALDLALDFQAWRRLTRSGLSQKQAVETMLAALLAQ